MTKSKMFDCYICKKRTKFEYKFAHGAKGVYRCIACRTAMKIHKEERHETKA